MNKASIWRFVLFALTSTVLAACGSTSVPEDAPPIRYTYALSVNIAPQDSRAEVEARYGGNALIWHPKAGFALLGIENSLVPQNAEANRESNLDAFSIPSVNAQGRSAWAGGRSAWAGGWSAWAGGTGKSGEPATTFKQNLTAWQQIDLAQAQALAPGLGKGVKVAVIDSGVDVYHPALQGKLAPQDEWRDFIDGDKLPLDEEDVSSSNAGHGHGTGVAGIILQVAPEAIILPLRVLKPDGSGDLTNVAMAIDWAAEQGADIINLSLGSDGDTGSKAVSKVLAYARQRHGVIVVASSGNTGDDKVTFPANIAQRDGHNTLVSVGSVDARNVRSSFSTYGPEISLYAPGEKVYTLMTDNGVTHATGTSFAAPVVTGTLALALGANDDGASQVQTLLSSVNDNVDSRDGAGTGMLAAGRFLDFAKNGTPTLDITLSSNTVLENQAMGTVVGSFSATGDAPSSYRLVAGEADNGDFTISGNELRTAQRFDFEAKSSYGVLVEVSGGSLTSREIFTVSVEDLDDENPVVAIDSRGPLTQGETVTLTGGAADNVGVSKLELYEGATLLGEATLSGALWRYDYTPRSAGTFVLKAVVSDAAGNVGEASLTVTVAQPERWPVQFGSAASDEVEVVTTDMEGNIYVAGRTLGNLGTDSAGAFDIFIVKYNSLGEQLWLKQFGSAADEKVENIAADANGDVYLVGYTRGNLGGDNTGGSDAFVIKLKSGGEQDWLQKFGTSVDETVEGVAVDADGIVYVTGHTQGRLGATHAGGADAFVAKLDGSNGGRQIWLEQFGGALDDQPESVALGAGSAVYVTGTTENGLEGSNAGDFDVFIARYDGNGEQTWLRQFGGAGYEEPEAVVTDSNGNVYMAGHTTSGLVGDNAGESDAFVTKYDGNGNRVWLKQFGDASDDKVSGAAMDKDDNIYMAGYTNGSLEGANVGNYDFFVTKYDSQGERVWLEQLGSTNYDSARDVATDADSNVYVTGSTHGVIADSKVGDSDAFIFKFDSGGTEK